ncbi:hypothetical protein HanPI659440_Chr01g0014061 [Helianthus annuus]|nr:hypothetical protein HanPI659440_Chr01g0014061 [Helianthus annuus]
MDFRALGPISEETPVVLKSAGWYNNLKALPNQAFGENTLVIVAISDKRPCDILEVPIFLQEGIEIDLYHRAFPTCSGVMGMRPLCEGEQLWYDKIWVNFMYATADAFATPPTATEGARFLNPRPCKAITSAGEEVIMLSSEESIASTKQG